jgi:hypothetical protein
MNWVQTHNLVVIDTDSVYLENITNISKPTTAGLEAKIAFIKKERAVKPSEIRSSPRPSGTGTNCQLIQLRPTQ